jgi:hypothetical protein
MLSGEVTIRGTAPKVGWHSDAAVVIEDTVLTLGGQEQGTVEIDDVAVLAHQGRRGHGQGRAAHVAYHDLEPQAASFTRHPQGLGQATAFIEFDVDYVAATEQAG